MDETIGRFIDMCRQAVKRDKAAFSRFLNLAEQRDAAVAAGKAGAEALFFGGQEDCERKMMGVGAFAPEQKDFPISCLLITPRGAKFAKELQHRDVLGSLMGLGIEREVIGDIAIREGGAYVFCETRMADFIQGALDKIGNTFVNVSLSEPPKGALRAVREVRVQVSSPRLDAVVAHLYKLSRGDAQALFQQGKVFIDDSVCERPDYALKENEVISVRGHGRARYKGVDGQSKKGKLYLLIEVYA